MFTISKAHVAMASVLLAGALGCTSAPVAQTSTPSASPETKAAEVATQDSNAKGEQAVTEASENAEAQKAVADKDTQVKADDKSAKAGNDKKDDAKMADNYHGLIPFKDVKAPVITEVVTILFKTSVGDITMEVYPQAAPNAAKRFVELCQAGFYDDTPIFRIVHGFVAQFGINWRQGMREWKDKNFDDDPSLFELGPGTLAFAKAGPNINSTQVFINYGQNSPLREQGGFSTFGRITKGYEVTKKFRAVGDPSMGLDQGILWINGGQYLDSLEQKPAMILSARVVTAK